MFEGIRRLAKLIYKYWMKIAHFIGEVNTKIILTLLYFVVFGLFSIVARLMGRDLLDKRLDAKPSYWSNKEKLQQDLARCAHQF